jgi:hypothetical protein
MIKYHPGLSISGLRLQATFTTMMLLSVLFMLAINPLSLRAHAQLSVTREKGMLDNGFFFLLDNGDYTFDIHGRQIFPNDQSKYSILTEHHPSVYNISGLTFAIMGHTINASNVQIDVQPTVIDDTKTKVNFEIYATKADVAGPWMSRSYNNLEIKSLYGIYDETTDKMIIHVPYTTVLSLLLQ